VISSSYIRSTPVMGTVATIQVVRPESDPEGAVERAFQWFTEIEQRCSRFEPQSELMQLTAHAGVEVPVSPILFEALQFALAVAEESGGAFDPTVGLQMEENGFNRDYKTGRPVQTTLLKETSATYRDIRLNPERRSVTLLQPLVLDLGAVAKGLAVDMAARELQLFKNYSVDAGGDLYLGGLNPDGQPWSVGIRHPRIDGELIEAIRISDRAVCTSGDYERGRHILDPRTAAAAGEVASVTVVADTAVLADAMATAAFVLGPAEGLRMFERHGVDGLIITPALERFATPGMAHA